VIYRAALLGAAGASFSPLDISGLQLWLDASDETTITESSGAVSQWDDKSGNANHVSQGVAAGQPTTGTATLNGLNVIRQDGGDALLSSNAFLLSSTTYTFLGVWRHTTESFALFGTDADDTFTGLGVSGVTSTAIDNNFAGVTYRKNGAGVSVATRSEVYTEYREQACLVGIEFTGGAANRQFIPFSYDGNVAYRPQADIAEVLVYEGALSTADREALEVYLAQKWGITLS